MKHTKRTHYFKTWDEALKVGEYVARTWPEAKHDGMGYWRIPRTAHIFYTGNPQRKDLGVASVTYEPMGRMAK